MSTDYTFYVVYFWLNAHVLSFKTDIFKKGASNDVLGNACMTCMQQFINGRTEKGRGHLEDYSTFTLDRLLHCINKIIFTLTMCVESVSG